MAKAAVEWIRDEVAKESRFFAADSFTRGSLAAPKG